MCSDTIEIIDINGDARLLVFAFHMFRCSALSRINIVMANHLHAIIP